jgi:hypothetical protein
MHKGLILAAPALALTLGGCLASTALDIATAPVRVVSQAADWATTSQDEADRARGRDIRRREERVGELQRKYDDLAEDCADGEDSACREAVEVRREIDGLLPGLPQEPPPR